MSFLCKGLVRILNGNARLLAINPNLNFLNQKDLTPKEKELFDKKASLEHQLAILNIEIQSRKKEISVLESYKAQNRGENPWTPEQYQNMAEYYGKRLIDLEKEVLTFQLEYKEASELLSRVDSQIQLENRSKNLNQNGLILSFESQKEEELKIEISFLVQQCGWIPHYDIRASGQEGPINITYKGQVWQTTGLDWNGISLELKTNQPYQNQDRPILRPYYAVFQHPNYQPAGLKLEERKQVNNSLGYIQAKVTANEDAYAVPEIVQTDVNLSYRLPSLYTIPTDGTKKMLWLDEKELLANFEFHSVPKLESKVILLGYIKNWNQLNLLSSHASVYFQNNYLGKITIDPNYVGDEFPLSFGVDERITVKRSKKNFVKEQFIGNKKVETVTYEITVRNNSQKSIEVDVLDQIPLTNTEDVKIELLDMDGANYNSKIGSLQWKILLEAGQTKQVEFTFEVKYPKDKKLYY